MHLGRALTASMGPMKLFASDHEAVTELGNILLTMHLFEQLFAGWRGDLEQVSRLSGFLQATGCPLGFPTAEFRVWMLLVLLPAFWARSRVPHRARGSKPP